MKALKENDSIMKALKEEDPIMKALKAFENDPIMKALKEDDSIMKALKAFENDPIMKALEAIEKSPPSWEPCHLPELRMPEFHIPAIATQKEVNEYQSVGVFMQRSADSIIH